MKLHLPKQLFTALLAAITLAAPATFSLGSSAWGVLEIEGADYGEPSTSISSDTTINPTADTAYNFTSNSMTLTGTASETVYNIKLDGLGSGNETNLNTIYANTLHLNTGRYYVDDLTDISNAGTIYVNAQLQFKVDGKTENDFVLGGSTFDPNATDGLGNVGLRVGWWDRRSDINEFSGTVTVAEDTRILFQSASNGSTGLNFSGTLNGSGNIQLDRYGTTNGTLIISGDTSAFAGVLDMDGDEISNGSVTLALGTASVHLGGLTSNAAASVKLYEGTASSTLTLDVAEGKDLTYAGTIGSADSTGISIVKSGAGSQTLSGAVNLSNLTVNAGALTITGTTTLSGTVTNNGTLNLAGSISVAEDQTATISGAGTTVLNSLTKTGEGVLNLGALKGALTAATLTGTLTVSGGTVQFTGTSGEKDAEEAKDAPSFVHLVRNLETSGTGKVKVDGDVLLNLTVAEPTRAADKTITIDDAIEITGKLQLNSYKTTNGSSADGDDLRKWVIADGADLSVGGELHMSNKQKLVVTGGKLTANGGIKLGYDNTTSEYYSVMVLSGGEVKTSGINLWQDRVDTAFSMTGGRLEFTPASETTSVITATNTGSTTTISGGTLVAGSSSWLLNLDANDSIGNVEFEIATGKTVTLGGTLGITGALTHNGAGTLKFADNAVVSITTDALNTLRHGAAEVANGENGLSTLQYYLVDGTGTVSTGSNVTLTVGGSSDGGYSFADGIISSGTNVYVINTSKSTADASTDTEFAGAGLYQVNSGAEFTIAGDISTTTTVPVLLQTTLGTGTIALTRTGNTTLSASTVFEGTLQVGDGVNLKIGSSEKSEVNVETLSGVELVEGGKVTYSGKSSTIKSVAVTGDSTFAINDMFSDSLSAATAVLTIKQLSVDSGKTLTSYAEWKHNLAIGKLTGEGEVDITGSGYNNTTGVGKSSSLTINSLQGFTGNLSITSKETSAGKNVYTATVSTGESAVDMGSLSFNDFTGSTGTATLNVQGVLSVDTLTAETATVNVSEGKTLALGNGTTEATHSIGTLSAASATVTVNDKSTLNLGAAAHTVGTLTGSGALAVTGTDSVTGSLVVKSATTGYTGNISLEKSSMSVWGLADFTVQSLTLNNATFSVNTRHNVSSGGNHTYTLNKVVVSGDDSVISVAADHKYWEAQIDIGNLSNTGGDATLTLESNFKNSTRNVFNLNDGAFSGTIKFVGSSADKLRRYALNIYSAAVVENAVIDVSKTTDYAHEMAIGIGVETVTVKGLTGGIAGAGIYSGSQAFGTSVAFSSDSTVRTLVIDADTDNSASPYTTSVAVSSNLNLEKKGLGTQVFTGDMSAFNGTIKVTGGKLAFTDSAGFSTSSATVSDGAELALGGTTTIGLLTATDSAISLESGAALTLSGGTAVALTSHSIGTLKANGGSLSLADYASLSIGTLEISSTLDLTQGANGAELTITNLSVVDGATLEAAENSTIVYIGSLDATTGTADGNGYKAAQGNVILIKGYEWNGSMDGVSSKDGNTYLTSSAPAIQGTTYYVQSGTVTVGGTNATAGVAAATSFDVAENTTLVIAELPTGWTTTDLLTGKVTGTGRIQMATRITVNNTDTVTFAGELEVTGEGTEFTVEGQQYNYVNLTNLSNIVVNNGAKVTYHATPEARGEGVTTPHLQKLSVESGTGTFWFKDANQAQTPTLIIGEAAVASGATLKLTSQWQDSAITIQNLTGGGEDGTGKLDVYSPNQGSESGVVNIQSLKEFTGALKFTKNTGNNFTATVATGSDGANFKSLEVDYSNTSGTAGFTFNVGGNTTIGTLRVGYGTVALGENVTLTLGGGKSDELAEHSISTLTTAAGAGVKLGDYASLELVSTQPNGYAGGNTGNADSTASLELAIFGGTGSVLKLHMDTNAGWEYNNTVKLSALTGETKTVDEVHVSGVLAADVFNGTASTDLGGAKLVMADASKLVLRKNGGTVNFGAGDIQLQGATTMELYGNDASTTRTLTNNISGDTLKTASSGAAELTGSVDLKALHVGSSMVTLAGGTDKKLQKLSAASGKVTAIAANTTLQMVDAQKATKVSFSSTDKENAATLTAKSDTALAQLQADASFTIEDMTLVNTTITAATVDTRVNLKNVSGDATLKTGTFALQVSANAPDNVGMGMSYAVTGTPSLTLANATAGDTKLVIAADPTADVSGAYGTYTLTFNLNLDLDASISIPETGNDWKELVGFKGWLGTMLENQGATYLPADEVEVAQVDAGTSTPTVSYSYTEGTGGNVGTLAIVISGLNVPEPTTSTLSLLALAALAARRRRK